MKANEFIKEVTLHWAKIALDKHKVLERYDVDAVELKCLVESWELVESYGGLNQAKQAMFDGDFHCMFIDLEKAIADVESCQ